MEKKQKDLSFDLDGAVLFFDDIDKIYKIFQTVSGDVGIETDDYKFKSIEDLYINFKGLSGMDALVIRCGSIDDFCRIRISKYGVSFTCDQKKGDQYLKVTNILRHSVPKLDFLRRWYFFQPANFIFVLFALFLEQIIDIFGVTNEKYREVLFFSGVFLVAIFWILACYCFLFRKPVKINPTWRSKRESFFTRNKDQIVVQTLTAIVAASLGSVFTYFLK
ncbi:hypothetical protein [Thalassospira povalilytica]|uniref:Uncharacterized protein n=1 Tax=Thalassospira povalilytica TaxID=732237 RepID=A0ABX4R587_9PROT|nr:hypothetical protein [Thalassospira povalilytica]PKR47559.1 hypothetical protein CU041_18225 [Thalassospira povalilytica]